VLRELGRSITQDQGAEMTRHVEFKVAMGVQAYFLCDPHSPRQRGSNQDTKGVLRQYLPKSTDPSKRSTSDLRNI
jgi:IS30 family transposase